MTRLLATVLVARACCQYQRKFMLLQTCRACAFCRHHWRFLFACTHHVIGSQLMTRLLATVCVLHVHSAENRKRLIFCLLLSICHRRQCRTEKTGRIWIMLMAKHYIFRCRCLKVTPNFVCFSREVKQRAVIGRHIWLMKDNLTMYFSLWSPYFPLINDIL